MTTKAISHPSHAARGGIVAGATRAPTEAPALKIDVANARSFLGKYSATALIAAGKLPASPIAKISRANIKNVTLTEIMVAIVCVLDIVSRAAVLSLFTHQSVATPQNACKHAPTDHIPMDHK